MSKQLLKLSQKILPEELREQFVTMVEGGVESPHALVWLANAEAHSWKKVDSTIALPDWIELVASEERPGKSDLHASGAFYLMDPSSVLMGMGLSGLAGQANSALDMCASPGGKTALIWRWLHPKKLVSNEVISKRHRALVSNIERCQIQSEVTQQDPAQWAELGGQFDLVFVDAPCSGQSLYCRGEAEPGCFHPSTVNGCRLRQRRILAESAKCVAPGGWLLYSTCTYAPDENEEVIEWFLKKRDDFHAQEIPALDGLSSKLSSEKCYRFFPDPIMGSGGFCALLRRNGTLESSEPEFPENWVKWRPR